MAVYSYTRGEARQHMYDTFLATWNDPVAGWAGIDGLTEAPELRFDNVKARGKTPVEAPWVRIYVRHRNDGSQVALGAEGRKMFERRGMVIVDIHVPQDGGLNLADDLVKVCKSAFEGRRAIGDGYGIVFQNVQAPENGDAEEPKKDFSMSVLADFTYNEVVN